MASGEVKLTLAPAVSSVSDAGNASVGMAATIDSPTKTVALELLATKVTYWLLMLA